MDITLVDGKLNLIGLSTKNKKIMYNRLRTDLLDCNITHFRPVAFKMEGDMNNRVDSNISKIPGFGYSFSELSFLLDNIILSEKKGIMPVSLEYANNTKLRSDCSYITMSGSTISSNEVGSIFYCGEGMSSVPRFLLNDFVVFRKLKAPITLNVVLMRGNGIKDFTDNQRLIYGTDYKPMRTIYGLHKYFRVREFIDGQFIQLDYLVNINEDILKSILYDYFNQEEVLVCLE